MISEEFLFKYKHTPTNKPLNKFLYKENLIAKLMHHLNMVSRLSLIYNLYPWRLEHNQRVGQWLLNLCINCTLVLIDHAHSHTCLGANDFSMLTIILESHLSTL